MASFDFNEALASIERDLLGPDLAPGAGVSSLLGGEQPCSSRGGAAGRSYRRTQLRRDPRSETPLTKELTSFGMAGVLRFFEGVQAEVDPDVRLEQRDAARGLGATVELPRYDAPIELPATRERVGPPPSVRLAAVAEQPESPSADDACTQTSPRRAVEPPQAQRIPAPVVRVHPSTAWWNDALQSEKRLVLELAALDDTLSKKADAMRASKKAAALALSARSERRRRDAEQRSRRSPQRVAAPALQGDGAAEVPSASSATHAHEMHIPLDVRVSVSGTWSRLPLTFRANASHHLTCSPSHLCPRLRLSCAARHAARWRRRRGRGSAAALRPRPNRVQRCYGAPRARALGAVAYRAQRDLQLEPARSAGRARGARASKKMSPTTSRLRNSYFLEVAIYW